MSKFTREVGDGLALGFMAILAFVLVLQLFR
jgi:hypothetical protein